MEDVTKAFGRQKILDGLNLSIPRGKITVIIGGSGSGKSVLVKHIIGLLMPDRGRILVDGEDITGLSGRDLNRVRAKFGMLFQGAALFDSMSVEENVAFPLVEHTKLGKREIAQMVARQLEVLGLPGIQRKMPAELSGGMKKRVGLARALIMKPQIMIYDEPTTGLDPVMIKYVDDMIAETQERERITSVVISHDMASTFRIAQKVAMLHGGKISVEGSPEEIIHHPDAALQDFLKSAGVGGILEGPVSHGHSVSLGSSSGSGVDGTCREERQ